MKVKIITSVIITIIVFLYLINVASTFGQQINITDNANNSSYLSSKLEIPENDATRPLVNITYPIYPPTITTNKIIINGTASDTGSGILNLSAIAHTFPFKDTFPVPLASQPIPISPHNWSKWSVPFIINDTNSYRVAVSYTHLTLPTIYSV